MTYNHYEKDSYLYNMILDYEQRKLIIYHGYEKKEWLWCQTST